MSCEGITLEDLLGEEYVIGLLWNYHFNSLLASPINHPTGMLAATSLEPCLELQQFPISTSLSLDDC